MSQRLIVTADDYGLCQPVNQAIEECLTAGTVRATRVMANMPAYTEISALRKKFPHVSIGIHWNLTQGRPILPGSRISSLVDSTGSFLAPTELRRRWRLRQVNVNEIRAELKAQFDRLVDKAGPLDFWNTHQNSHVSGLVPGSCESRERA